MAKEITENEFEAEVINSEKPAVVDFFADWCGPCKMMAPVFAQLSEEITDCAFFKVNIDKCPDLAARYAVMSIPTVMVFKGGQPVETVVGFLPGQELAKKIEGALNG